MHTARLLNIRFVILLLATISTVLGCGVMPAGQSRSTIFTVTGFSLPVTMVYSGSAEVSAQVPGIASNKGGVQAFVQRLVMQTIFDVLELQGRSVLLSDAVISSILGQLSVNITYEPLECQAVAINAMGEVEMGMTVRRCVIVSNTVTGICTAGARKGMCNMPKAGEATVMSVPATYTSISGTLSTTNIIMASWSTAIWRNVLNRAVRMLASAPFGPHFISAMATVGGN
ncbi:hypothetical protein KIN20_010672 [Parelaphostrongylus tenuis]|uniref:Uncharacterized protein n=1 Tax=Parelaphostrongylus tenuis TaxID=148309 RepID=A0AAD5MUC0_PARTN|nr:hypothetical protein KIN20_010672 [Parelaphostrongylus tenuis]